MDDKSHAIIVEFAGLLGRSAAALLGLDRIKSAVGDNPSKAIFLNEGNNNKSFKTTPAIFDAVAIGKGIADITKVLFGAFGASLTEARLEDLYTVLEKKYTVSQVGQALLPLIPEGFLENHRVQYLSKEELEARVFDKTKELRKLNLELEARVMERTAELHSMLLEQERSGKLLVRRDLELTSANEKLRDLDKRKSEFLSVAAHQLRTPLSGIKWTLNMILNNELGPVSDAQRVFLMKSYESNERMINLVEDMLHADRIDAGRYNLKLSSTQVLDLIDNLLYEILPGAEKRKIKIEFHHPNTVLPKLNIDQEKIRAVFQNLIDNAVKYSRPGGTVSIDAELLPSYVQFIIRDHGIGIPADQQALIFSRLFRARNALKIETDGTGLGLFIVKSIIEMHGGKIWFESKENEGSAFYFTLKL